MKKLVIYIFSCYFFCSNILFAQSKFFSFDNVIDKAQDLASEAYVQQKPSSQDNRSLTYDQYRSIRFKRTQAISVASDSSFKFEVLPAGYRFTNTINVYLVKNGVPVKFIPDSDMFENDSKTSISKGTKIPVSGLRILSTINSPDLLDEFLVFQGASYFRAVPKKGQYGLSARGIVVHPTRKKSEEFPVFTDFWIQQSASDKKSITIYALMNGPSETGAYQFIVEAGSDTQVKIKAVVFARTELAHPGIAPLTSMFFFDSSNKYRIDDFRNGVHDSDGYWIKTADNECLWRQLINPNQVEYSSFTNKKPQAFGLLQRNRNMSDYQDFEAEYEKRPDAWIEPGKDWPEGTADLLEIPTDSETNDNIVTFWNVKKVLHPKDSLSFSYILHWTLGLPQIFAEPAKVLATRSGAAFSQMEGERTFIIDFSDPGVSIDKLTSSITCSKGKIIASHIEYNPLTKGVRLSFNLYQKKDQTSELRGLLLYKGKPVTETWLYRWSNDE